MNRFYFLSIALFAIAFSGFSQHTLINAKVIDNLPKFSNSRLNKKSNINPKTCGRDTAEYPRYKASRLYFIGMKKGYSLGQFYGAPQDITVHGFTFYSFIYTPPPGPPTDKTIRLICNIYKAGVDSLPTGSPLRSDTVTVDSTFGAGLLSNVVKRANFKTPITVNYPYILTVESDSSNINASVVANDWNSGDGDSMNLLCGSVTGRWYRGLNLNIGGVTLDADVLLHPHVSYKFGADFTFTNCSEFKDTVKFKNSYKSTVSGSMYYNFYNFYPYDWFCHQWNYSEQPWDVYQVQGANKFTGRGNFKIRLISRVYQWHGNAVCTDTTEKIIYFKPRDPFPVSKTNICRGDSANIRVASDTGTIIKWYKSPASPNPVHIGNLYKLGIPQSNDTFFLKAFNYGCESGFSQIIVAVNDYPKHPVINNDSICQGAKANLLAKSVLGITEWYTDSLKLPFYFGDLMQTAILNNNLSYLVRTNNKGCYSPYFKKITAYVDSSFAPADPLVSNDTVICLRPLGTALLKAYSTSLDTIKWYNVPSGGSSIAVGNSYQYNPSAKGDYKLYAQAEKSTCASSRLGIKITVSDYPAISKIFNDEKCKGDTGQIGVSLASTGNVRWYEAPSGGSPFSFGYIIRYFSDKTKNLYAEADENGCTNPVRATVNLKINFYDSITKIDVPLVCGTASATLKVTAGTSNVKWYEDDSTTKLLSGSATFITPKLLVSTNYYFTVEKNGCKSPVNTVLVEVLPLPIPGFKDSIIKGHKIRFTPYANSGVKYKWLMGDGTVYTSKLVVYSYASYGTFTVKLIVTNIATGCVDSSSQEVVFDFSGIRTIRNQALRIFPNPATEGFTVSLPEDLSKGNLSIINNIGKTVYKANIWDNHDVLIDETFAKGLYIIKVEWDKKSSYGRLMIQ